jgi:hypothetical protein
VTRAHAIGMGAVGQVFTHLLWFLLARKPDEQGSGHGRWLRHAFCSSDPACNGMEEK